MPARIDPFHCATPEAPRHDCASPAVPRSRAPRVRPLSLGKQRAFERIFADDGTALLLAADHGTALAELLDDACPESVSTRTLTGARHAVLDALAHEVDGVVLDPEYGAPEAIGSGVLPRDTALIVSAECAPRFDIESGARVSPLRTGWHATDARRLGADGAKLLMYHRPDLAAPTELQRHAVAAFVAECARQQLLALVECRTYALPDESSVMFAARRPSMLVDAVRAASELGADVVAVEWPARGCDEAHACRIYAELDRACNVPWLLTGTPDTDAIAFDAALRLACHAGASGAMVGRLLWQDGLLRPELEWAEWLRGVAAANARRLHATVRARAVPWWHWRGDLAGVLCAAEG